MVIDFEEPFDLNRNCTDARYSCLLAVGNNGAVKGGSARQLDTSGKLFQVTLTAAVCFASDDDAVQLVTFLFVCTL
jgi:hypothetical protein